MDIHQLVVDFNQALKKVRLTQQPGETIFPGVPSVLIRKPTTMDEVQTFGKDGNILCIEGREKYIFEVDNLMHMYEAVENITDHREKEKQLDEIRQRALTVITEEELQMFLDNGFSCMRHYVIT